MQTHVEREMLSLRQAAEVLGISQRSVWAYAKMGRLPTVRIGKRILIPRRLLIEQLENEALQGLKISLATQGDGNG